MRSLCGTENAIRTVNPEMGRKIFLSALRSVTVLFSGDLNELGLFLLRAYDARAREANARYSRVTVGPSRPTLH